MQFYNKEELTNTIKATQLSTELTDDDVQAIISTLISAGYGKIITFAEYVAGKIAGHSDYHGDSILCAIYCASEGKDIHTVKPLE